MYEQVKIIDSEYAEQNNIQKLIEEIQEKNELQSPESSHVKKGKEYEEQGKLKLANAEFYKVVQLCEKTDFTPLLFLFMNEVKINEDYKKIIIIGEKLFSMLNNRENKNVSSIFLDNICLGLHKFYKKLKDDINAEKYMRLSESYTHVNNAKKSNRITRL